MEYKRFENTLLVRLDQGEEILTQLEAISRAEHILLAEVSGLCAINEFTAGVYNTAEKRFSPNTFRGAYEIVSLTGTISTMNGKHYSHIHMSAGDAMGRVFGGHLSRAVISATGELVIRILNGQVDRAFDAQTGLNLFRFA